MTELGRGLRDVPRSSPGARQRISTTLLSLFPRRAAMPSAPSMPSCARPTTWPTTKALPRGAPRRLDAWLAEWRVRLPRRPTPPIRSLLPCATPRERFKIPLSLLDELVAGVTMDLSAAAQRCARHLRHIRRSLPLLLPGGFGRGPGLHPHLRLSRTRAPKSWPRRRASPSSSPTFCATWPKMPSAIASTCRWKIWRPTKFHWTRCCIAKPARRQQRTSARCSRRSPSAPRSYYQSAQALLPLIDRESRPALWVLVAIYHASAEAHRARGLRCVFAPRQRADGAEARNSGCRHGAHGLGAADCFD